MLSEFTFVILNRFVERKRNVRLVKV